MIVGVKRTQRGLSRGFFESRKVEIAFRMCPDSGITARLAGQLGAAHHIERKLDTRRNSNEQDACSRLKYGHLVIFVLRSCML